jgi:hypothetical protein
MGLIETIKQDIQKITTDLSGFGIEINLTTPDDALSVDIVGLHTKHHLGIDTEGNQVNTKNTHIAISEQVLIDLGYPVRNANEEVFLRDHKVLAKDSTGVLKSYVIREWLPDETIGLIVCILGDYQ